MKADAANGGLDAGFGQAFGIVDREGLNAALYEATNVISTKPVKAGALKSCAMRLADRAGKKKAKVALARKLALILHRMLVNSTPVDADKAAMARG